MCVDDVAVVDEVQMIQDPDRGGAWARAVLGEPAQLMEVWTIKCYQCCICAVAIDVPRGVWLVQEF